MPKINSAGCVEVLKIDTQCQECQSDGMSVPEIDKQCQECQSDGMLVLEIINSVRDK